MGTSQHTLLLVALGYYIVKLLFMHHVLICSSPPGDELRDSQCSLCAKRSVRCNCVEKRVLNSEVSKAISLYLQPP